MEALGPQLALRMETQPSAALVLLARLLQLPATEIGDAVDEAVGTNPALELADRPRCPICRRVVRAGRCVWCGPAVIDRRDRSSDGDARHVLALDLAAVLPPALRSLAARVVDELDDHGLLGRSVPALAAELGVRAGVVQQVVDALSQVAPAGVGAPDVVSSLLAQLDAWQGDPAPAGTALVIREAGALLDGGVAALARATGLAPADVQAALTFVATHLAPSPLDLGRTAPPAPVSVDVIVREGDDGELEVQVARGSAYGVQVSPAIRLAAGDPSIPAGTRDWALRELRSARTFLAQLDERSDLLLLIVEAAVAHQVGFIRRGPIEHRPLTRSALAARVGVHESTVSRAVAGKRMRLPDGSVEPLRCLFGTNVAVKAVLGDLLRAGSCRSDRDLAARLRALGHPLARRTVAKYRAELERERTSAR